MVNKVIRAEGEIRSFFLIDHTRMYGEADLLLRSSSSDSSSALRLVIFRPTDRKGVDLIDDSEVNFLDSFSPAGHSFWRCAGSVGATAGLKVDGGVWRRDLSDTSDPCLRVMPGDVVGFVSSHDTLTKSSSSSSSSPTIRVESYEPGMQQVSF